MPFNVQLNGKELNVIFDLNSGGYKNVSEVREVIKHRLDSFVIDVINIGGPNGKALLPNEALNGDKLETLLIEIQELHSSSKVVKSRARSALQKSKAAKELRLFKDKQIDAERKKLAKAWFYSKDGSNEVGPITELEVFKMLQSGDLSKTHLLWKDGFDDWMHVSAIPEFDEVTEEKTSPRQSNTTISGDKELSITATGTGWLCGEGVIATNYHVISAAQSISIYSNGNEYPASILAEDKVNDLALVKVVSGLSNNQPLPVSSQQVRIGTSVLTIGYPHTDIMGEKPKLTNGVISAASGVLDDRRLYQITVPLQSGNSGGPLIDQQGMVVGVVTSKLSALAMYERSGDIPQNVNYAIKSGYLTVLMETEGVNSFSTPVEGSMESIAEAYSEAVFIVIGRGSR